jgi:hypothetical protein
MPSNFDKSAFKMDLGFNEMGWTGREPDAHQPEERRSESPHRPSAETPAILL